MSGRELFVLIVGGVLALWGMLSWRIAWTGELPQSLQGGGGGWRRRLRLGLAAAPPTGRLMPLLIVAVWTLYLMFVLLIISGQLDGAAARITRTLGIGLLVAFVALALLALAVRLFNRPQAVIPPYARDHR